MITTKNIQDIRFIIKQANNKTKEEFISWAGDWCNDECYWDNGELVTFDFNTIKATFNKEKGYLLPRVQIIDEYSGKITCSMGIAEKEIYFPTTEKDEIEKLAELMRWYGEKFE